MPKAGIDPNCFASVPPEDYDPDEGVCAPTSDGSSQSPVKKNPALPCTDRRGINRTPMTDAEALFDGLRRKHGRDLLSDDEIARLLDYMEFLLDVVVDDGVRRGSTLELHTKSGERHGLPWDDAEEMERILWRTGRIDDKTYVPR